MPKSIARKRSAPTIPNTTATEWSSRDPLTQKFDRALCQLLKEIVNNSVETNQKFDKLQELLTNESEDVENVEK